MPAQSFSANGNQYGDEINLSATSDELDLTASGMTITRGSGTESLKAGSSVFSFSSSDYRSTETIDAQPGDHFVFSPQFGHETIRGSMRWDRAPTHWPVPFDDRRRRPRKPLLIA